MQKNLYQFVKYSSINSQWRQPAYEQDMSDSWRPTTTNDFANWKRMGCWKKWPS